jgi:DNA-binding CsgD family transcriptional regulator
MLTMTQKHNIRKMFFEKGKTSSQILREIGRDRKSVRFYLGKDDGRMRYRR